MDMKKGDLISGVLLLAIAITTLFEASRLPFGSLRAPQAGFLPVVLSIVLTIFSCIFLVQTIRTNRDGASFLGLNRGYLKKVGLAAGSLLGFALVLEYLGYIISTFVLIAFLLRVIEPQKWWVVIGFSSLISLATYILFSLFLSSPLPKGIMGF
jgi:putative tricarboxylic transport membrane protein